MKLPGNMQSMMKQAQQMQEKMQQEVALIRVEGTAGGGMVAVKMDGQKNVLAVKIDPEVAGDVEMLQDMVVAACNEAVKKVDEETKQKFIPHVVEPSAGVDRTVLALICEAYSEDEAPDEKGKMETRTVLRFHPRMAPIKCAVFPLLKNKELLVAKAKEIVDLLRPHMFVFYDESGAIGRRYRRQDEVGTPFGITVDFETLGEKDEALKDTVTVRERDSMKQERVAIKDLVALLAERVR